MALKSNYDHISKILIIFFLCLSRIVQCQNNEENETILLPSKLTSRKLFLHADYQFLKYDYFQFGIGFNPKKHFISVNRKNESVDFLGYRISYSTNFKSSDWGLNLQCLALQGHYNEGFGGFGIEINIKSINNLKHYGFKPLIGFAFPNWNLMYGYNFDFFKDKSSRISQHEIILGINLQVLKFDK